MPHSGYHDAAEKRTLLLAYLDGRVVGYALYALARRRVRLTHLCVDPNLQKRGIAAQLVEWISNTHADHLGISVRCRHDYNLGRMWIRLRFAQIGERPGRSIQGHPVVDWWRDHGHPSLFTPDPEAVLVRAAVDLNVLRDLAEPGRPDREESQALLADHLVGRIELSRTAALNTEIDAMQGELRTRCARQAQPLTMVYGDADAVARVSGEVLAAARQVEPAYPSNEQDRLDLQHVADAIACGLNVFITRDLRLTRILAKPAGRHGLRIMRPADVVVHIDELTRAEAYRPAALLATAYTRRLIRSEADHDLGPLVNTGAGERPQVLARRMRELAVAGHDRVGVFDPDGGLVAAFGTVPTAGVLDVPLLRVAPGPLADTLAHQLLFHLRQQARDAATPVVRVTDSATSPQLRRAALSDGFYPVGDELYGYVLAAVGSAQDVNHRAAAAARHAGLPEPPSLRSGMAAVVAAETERVWWPVKITDSELVTYIIPIWQAYSTRLLGVPPGLLPRPETLGLSHEHVYYRKPAGTRVEAPARLLWYASGGGPHQPERPAIIACSQLDLVLNTTPDEAHSRFQHLGVWDQPTIQKAALNGKVQALRFTNTAIFPHPIPWPRLRQLAHQYGYADRPLRGPVRIPTPLFTAIYQEGRTG
jgi:GNAT superfamily N-acetyltransferase